MFNLFTLLKTYILTSILWFVFMLSIIVQRLINNENVNDVFGISLIDTTLVVFAILTAVFVCMVLHFNKIYFDHNRIIFV